MINMPKESTSYVILSNIWLGVMILSTHTHDAIFSGLVALLWFVVGIYVSRKENSNS